MKLPKKGICVYCKRPVLLTTDELISPHFGHPIYGGYMTRKTARKCSRGGYPPLQVMRALIVISNLGDSMKEVCHRCKRPRCICRNMEA